MTTCVPSTARVQNALMGGYDNGAADREVAQALAAAHPVLSVLNRQNRRFVERTVRQLAEGGIRQFLDLGCGLPLTVAGKRWPMVHEAAGSGARVAYVDCDPMAVRHTSAAAGNGNVTVIEANLADPDSELIGEAMQDMAGTGEPVCLIAASVLHYWTAPAARSIIDGYADLLPAGSAVVVTCAHFDCDAAMDERRRLVSLPFHNHSASDLESFFTAAGLKLTGSVGDVASMSVAGVRKPAVMFGAVGVKP